MRTVLNNSEEIILPCCWKCGSEARVENAFGLMCFECEADMPETITCHCGGSVLPSLDSDTHLSPGEMVCTGCKLVYLVLEVDTCV